jgi:hypothetical protein
MGLLSGKSEPVPKGPAAPEPVPEYNPYDKDLCTRFGNILRSLEDPFGQRQVSGVSKLPCSKVCAVFPEDARGLVEVLYLVGGSPTYINGKVNEATPMTAFLRGRELAYITEGW